MLAGGWGDQEAGSKWGGGALLEGVVGPDLGRSGGKDGASVEEPGLQVRACVRDQPRPPPAAVFTPGWCELRRPRLGLVRIQGEDSLNPKP